MTDTVLIVDDEPDLLRGLSRTIAMEINCRIIKARNSSEALGVLHKEPVDVVLTDIRMPGMDGLEMLQAIKKFDSSITVIIMTAYGTIEHAVDAIKAGAYDFIQKPFDETRLIHLLNKGLEFNRLVRENTRLLKKNFAKAPIPIMVGRSEPMLKVFETIQLLSQSDVTVLIRGDTGTGKDLAARAIHEYSARGNRPMETVNCPALPENILESELFGYLKGAFTSAYEHRRGRLDEANGSTIFLDEIGDMSLSVQTKLLRVLEDKYIQPLGANKGHRVDVRIIAATNQDLETKIKKRQFREDLYYRLNVALLKMPPLKGIRSDIPLLVEHILKKISREQNMKLKKLGPEVMNYLLQRDWPGNIRELENTIRGWVATTPGPVIEHVPESDINKQKASWPAVFDQNQPYKMLKQKVIKEFTINYIDQLLNQTSGNISLAAQTSGIKRQSLQKIIKRYGISMSRYR